MYLFYNVFLMIIIN